MSDFFNPQNWLDLTREDSFWSIAMIIAGILMVVALVLFSDVVNQLRADQQERAKWFYWNKPKAR